MHEVRLAANAWEGDGEGAVTTWFYKSGAQVGEGALLAEVMVDKATVEIYAPVAGNLTIAQAADSLVRPGALLATLS